MKIKIKILGFDMAKLELFEDKLTFFEKLSQILKKNITFTSSLELRVTHIDNIPVKTLSTLMGIAIC